MRAAAAVKRRTEMEALWSKGPTALAELRRKIAAASSPLQSQLEQAAMDLAQAQAAAQQPGRWGPVPGLPDALPFGSMDGTSIVLRHVQVLNRMEQQSDMVTGQLQRPESKARLLCKPFRFNTDKDCLFLNLLE
jgi:hypothetical protein